MVPFDTKLRDVSPVFVTTASLHQLSDFLDDIVGQSSFFFSQRDVYTRIIRFCLHLMIGRAFRSFYFVTTDDFPILVDHLAPFGLDITEAVLDQGQLTRNTARCSREMRGNKTYEMTGLDDVRIEGTDDHSILRHPDLLGNSL